MTMKKFSKPRWLSGRTAVIGIPYFWLTLCSLLPFLIVLKISFGEMDASGPFGSLLSYVDGVLELKVKLTNYLYLAMDDLYIIAYLN